MRFPWFKKQTPVRLEQLVEDEVAALREGLQAVRAGRRAPMAHQIRFYRRMDEMLGEVRDPPGHDLACKSGCAYCCGPRPKAHKKGAPWAPLARQ